MPETAKKSRKVAILGPIPADHVTTHRGEVFEKYGCALYTAAALASLLGPDDVVAPIVHVREQDFEPIAELLSPFPNIDLTGIRTHTNRGDVIQLTYRDQNFRDEAQTGFMHPLMPDDVEFALDADLFVGVPITDYEVSLWTLAHIKANSSAPILYDCHGPTVALTRGGQRVPRLWLDRDAWLPQLDIIKMNLEEAGCSWFQPPGGVAAEIGAPLPRSELSAFAEHCLDRGTKAVCVTLDQEGCALFFRGPDGELVEEIVAQVPIETVVDTTGCGDSFAAGMGFGYLETGDFVAAAQYGNAMGAQRASGSDLTVYRDKAGTDAQIKQAYGDAARVGKSDR